MVGPAWEELTRLRCSQVGADGESTDEAPEAAGEREIPTEGGAPSTYVLQLQQLSQKQGGTVENRYSPHTLIRSLELKRHMRAGAKVDDVLIASAALLLGDAAGHDVERQIGQGGCALPSVALLRVARIRLDILGILFHQKQWLRTQSLEYDLVDSSPQLGYNILAVIEDTIIVPETHTLTAHMEISSALQLSSQMCPLSSLAFGKAGLLKKSQNHVNISLMQSGTLELLEVKRKRKRGCTTDQGTEKGLGDMSADLVPALAGQARPGTPDSFLWPNLLATPGALHMLYDALENAVKSNPGYKDFVDILQITQTFLNAKEIITKFQKSCLTEGTPEHAMFNTGAKRHIDWKWEFLSKALDEQLPKFRVVASKLDAKKVLLGDSGMLTNSKVQNMDRVRKDVKFEPIALAYLNAGKIIERTAKDLEICDCHEFLWKAQKLSRKRRAAQMREHLGEKKCVWMGRRLAWFICVGRKNMMRAIAEDTSEDLANCLVALPSEQRSAVVGHIDLLRQGLLEQIQAKLGFLDHIPWRAIGAFYCVQGGSVADSQNLLRGALAEYDDAITTGKRHMLHRVCHRLFGPGPIRAAADAWLAGPSDAALLGHPPLYVALMEYALIPFVERRIEGVHALVKMLGKVATGISLAQICGLLRQSFHLDQIKNNAEFFSHCIKEWRKRDVMSRVLQLRFSEIELQAMTHKEKINAIYQTGVAEEYVDLSAAAGAHSVWLQQTQANRAAPIELRVDEKGAVQYLKASLAVGTFWSLPRDVFNSGVVDAGDAQAPPYAIPANILATIFGAAPMHAIDSSTNPDDMIVFRIVNAHPEKRTLVQLHHLLARTTTIVVAPCIAQVRGDGEASRMIIDVQRDLIHLDLLAMLPDFNSTLYTLMQWKINKGIAIPRLKNFTDQELRIMNGSALVPMIAGVIDQGPCALADNVVRDMQRAVVVLAKEQAYVDGPRALQFQDSRFDNIHMDTIFSLIDVGAIHISNNEFSEMELRVDPKFLAWDFKQGLSRPLSLMCVTTSAPPAKQTKLGLMICLHQNGWEKSDVVTGLAPITAASPRQFHCSWMRPLSYFQALASAQLLFDKGVLTILQDSTDHYYKGLVGLKGAELTKFIEAIADNLHNDSFIKGILKNAGVESEAEEEARPEGLPHPGEAALLAIPDDAMPTVNVIPEQAIDDSWTRCIARLGPLSPPLKIYFDHCTHASGVQRGFIECRHHGCTHWLQIFGDKRTFVAHLYLWERGGEDIDTRLLHQRYVPDSATVESMRDILTMEPF